MAVFLFGFILMVLYFPRSSEPTINAVTSGKIEIAINMHI